MAIADEDKCPQCGTPYMSMLSPDDIIDTRICSTCDAEKGNAEFASNLGGGDNEELALQGFEPDARDSKVPKKARIKNGNLRQQILADVRSKHRNERTTALREGKAAKAEAAQAAESAEVETQAEAPELSQDAPQLAPAGSGVRAAKSSGRLNPASRISARGIPAAARASGSGLRATGSGLSPATRASVSGMSAATKATGSGLNSATRASKSGMAPATRSGRMPVPPASPMKTYLTYGVIGVVVLVGGIIGLKAMNKPSGPAVTVAAAEPAKVLPKQTPKEPKKEAQPEKIETAAPAVPAVVETPADPAVKEVEKKPEVSDVLGLNAARKSAKAKAGDDDEPVAAVATTPAAVAPGAEKPVDPAATPKAGAAKPPEKQSALAAITKKKPEEEPEPEKFVNKPPPMIPVTAIEPSIVAIDIQKMDAGPERTLTESAQGAFPGWRIRDLNSQNSTIGSSFRGRDKVAALNPLNEKLGAKLIATIEIPKTFAGKRPMLLFEVASKDGNRDWVLSAKVKGMDMLKVVIKTKDEQPWIDQGVDLSPLIGLRFEMTLEAATKQKKPKDMKEEMGYIRNIRLEWAGKAKPATPPPPAKKP